MTNDFCTPYLPVCICLDTGITTSNEPEKLFRWMLRELKAGFDATLGEACRPEFLLICCACLHPHIICPGRGENRRNLLLFAPHLPWHRELCRRLYLLCTTCRDTLRHLFHRCTPFHTTPFHTPS